MDFQHLHYSKEGQSCPLGLRLLCPQQGHQAQGLPNPSYSRYSFMLQWLQVPFQT